MKTILSIIFGSVALSILGCSYLSVSCAICPNIRVKNTSKEMLEVSISSGAGKVSVEVLNPGQSTTNYGSVAQVRCPHWVKRISGNLFQTENANNYKRSIVHHVSTNIIDVVYEVSFDDNGKTWIESTSGQNVYLPLPVK